MLSKTDTAIKYSGTEVQMLALFPASSHTSDGRLAAGPGNKANQMLVRLLDWDELVQMKPTSIYKCMECNWHTTLQ